MISVIVPIYNAGASLERCIVSILKQSYINFELLLIDDGSTDNSSIICEDYAEKDERIRFFHKKNRGVSSARNFGLSQAKGRWVCFIDADDWIEEDCFEYCFRYESDNLDLIMFSCIWADDSRLPDRLCDSIDDFKEVLPLFIDKITFVTPWCKFFKKCILDEYKITFDTKLSSAEDTLFSFEYLKYVKKLKLISHEFYHYDISQNANSLSKRKGLNWQTEEYILRKIFLVVNDLEDIFDVHLTKFRCLMGESRLNKYLASFSEITYFNARKRLRDILNNKELSYLFMDKVFMPKGERRKICDWLIRKRFVSLLAFYFRYVRTEY